MPLKGRALDFTGGVLGAIGMFAVVMLAFAAITVPTFLALWVVSIVLPGQLRADNILILVADSLAISVLMFAGENFIAWRLKRHPVATIAGDAVRRLWIGIVAWVSASVVLQYSPGVALRGPVPALTVAVLGAVIDLVTEYLSALRQRNRPS